MSYTAAINQAKPTAFLFLIDQSRSMKEKMDAGETKAKFVGDVLNKTLFQLIGRCNSVDGVRDYFDIGVLAYRGSGVHSGFGGALSASALHPISSLAKYPVRVEERKKRVPDGAGGVVDQSVKFPVWFESVSDGDTPICEGFRKAAECLVKWCGSNPKSHPPTIIHITGGPPSDGDPERLAEAIRHISTNHGQCLLFNLHIGTAGSASVIFPASEIGLPDSYSKMLFRMSSLFPAHLIKPAQEKGYNASAGSRFFGYKVGYEGLVNFFDIGRRVSSLLLSESMSPQSGQTFGRSATGSGANDESDQVKLSSAQRAKPQSVEAPKPQPPPPEPARAAIGRRQRPAWPQAVRMLGLAVAAIAGIAIFKQFGIGSGPQPAQFSNQTPTTPAKDDSASKLRLSDDGQSIGLSAGPNASADSNSERGSALFPDATKASPPADNGSKLAAGSAQTTKPALMSPPQDIDQPNVADARTANPSYPVVETNAADTSSVTISLDLGKVPDAKRVQQRLTDLGYFSGPVNGVFGPKSRRALSDFRSAEKIGQDDQWDQATEKKLFSTSTARKQQSLAFVGSWSKDASSCIDPPIKITASRAVSRDANCELNSIRQEAERRWSVKAHCELASSLRTEDTENSWTSNIELTLQDRRLIWESEMGTESYYRCSQ
jgi:hypothetical protein